MKTPPAISLADRLAVLGDPIRLRMMRLLELQELSVGEVAKVLQMAQSSASRHLKALAEAKWMSRRSEGPATFYRLVLDDLDATARGLWLAAREGAAGAGELLEDHERLAAVLAERRTDSAAFFGRVAGEWDSVRGQLFGERFTPAALMGFMPRGWVVADLGCGTGDAAELLAPVVRKVIAVDGSEPMLAAGRERLRGVQNVEFVQASLESLPLKDASVDAAVMVLVLHHLEAPTAVLRECRRILRPAPGKSAGESAPGGLMVVDMVGHDRGEYRQTMGHKHLGFSRAGFEALMREAGFGAVQYRELPREPEAKGPGLFVGTGQI